MKKFFENLFILPWKFPNWLSRDKTSSTLTTEYTFNKYMQTIGKVKQHINPNLKIDGILLNIVDNRTNLAKSTADALRKNYGSVIKIYHSAIPMAVKAAEVASKGVSIYKYEPNSPAAKAYAELTKEVLADGRKKERLHSADAR